MAKNMRMLGLLLVVVIVVAPTIKSDINFYSARKLIRRPILSRVEIHPVNNASVANSKSVLRRQIESSPDKQIELLKIPTIALEEKVWKKPFNINSNVVKKLIFEKKSSYCTVDFTDHRKYFKMDPYLPMIYFVTPTYPRPEQIAELIQLSHTLMHVPRIFWIVADDNIACSQEVSTILKRSRLPFAHISSPKPEVHSDNQKGNEKYPRGLATRRAALKFIYKYLNDGIVYFGDDDNTYDLEVFNEIRKTKKISMLPVGLIGSYGISSPLVSNGKVIGFFDSWFGGKNFAIDMAGFAININHLKKYTTMKYEVGAIENNFLIAAGFEVDDIEPLANNCTDVLVWHTQTVKSPIRNIKFNIDRAYDFKYDNLPLLLRQLVKRNVVRTDPNTGLVPKVIKYNKFMMMMRIPLKLF